MNRIKIRIHLFYTYTHWFGLHWFRVIVEHTASPLNPILSWLLRQDNFAVFQRFRSKRRILYSSQSFCSLNYDIDGVRARKRECRAFLHL